MEQDTPIPPESVARGHETRDASVRAIAIFVIALSLGTCAVCFAVYGIMRHMQSHNANTDSTPSPLAAEREFTTETPLQPSLDHPSLPHEDLMVLRARWRDELASYSRVQDQPGIVSIPIERAMQIIAERGIRPTTRPGGAR